MIFRLVVLLYLLLRTSGYDVPLEKAIPPPMEPRPQVPKITHRVFLKVRIADENGDSEEDQIDTIVLGLFGEIAPKLVNNFVSLARCDKGIGALSGKPLCYKGSTFHRIVPGFLIQGGDFVFGDGRGGETVYNGQLIEDETFEVHQNRPYVLSMSNRGVRNSNGSQFFINTVKAQWLEGLYVGFGLVLEGKDFIHDIEKKGTSAGKPRTTVTIIDCGEMDLAPEDKELKYW